MVSIYTQGKKTKSLNAQDILKYFIYELPRKRAKAGKENFEGNL